MKLVQLDAQFYRLNAQDHYTRCDKLADAQGIMFQCPACQQKDGHYLLVWFSDKGVPEAKLPRPRWKAEGIDLTDLTLTPSISVAGCWHGYIKKGEAINA